MSRFFLVDLPFLFLVVGVVVFLLVTRRVLMVRLKNRQRSLFYRLLPLAEVVIGLLLLVWLLWAFLPEGPVYLWIAVGLMAALLVAGGWFGVRDFISGVILRTENSYRAGQWIKVKAAEGFIQKVGYRGLTLETEQGVQVRLPYGTLVSQPLVMADRLEETTAHTFHLTLPSNERPVGDLIAALREQVLTSFWASVRREPYIQFKKEDNGVLHFDVTVYALDDPFHADLEHTLRRHFADQQDAAAS